MKRVIHWFRRDLRITDNIALTAAATSAGIQGQVIPVYIASESYKSHQWMSSARQKFLCGSLATLADNLEKLGGRLIVRRGDALEEIEKLIDESGATSVFTNRDPDPFGWFIESKMKIIAKNRGLEFSLHSDAFMHEHDAIMTTKGTAFRFFAPYSKVWFNLPKPNPLPTLTKINTPINIQSLPIPQLSDWGLTSSATIQSPGESAAQKRLQSFISGPISAYCSQRDFMGVPATSHLSQDLRFGLLSPRQIYGAVKSIESDLRILERKSIMKFLSELVWREFSMYLLWHYPEVLKQEFNMTWRGMSWPGLPSVPNSFERWSSGMTGFPIVDASMRQLASTGWMHNRSRMITAMFLTKDLHLDWRLGEAFFMRSLVDGEIASNNCGWQWSAGTGADAAPYFRIQNPWLQTKRYDPEGVYIRHWIPELRNVPTRLLMQAPADGCSIASNYPAPILDHFVERNKTLEFFAKHKTLLSQKDTLTHFPISPCVSIR